MGVGDRESERGGFQEQKEPRETGPSLANILSEFTKDLRSADVVH